MLNCSYGLGYAKDESILSLLLTGFILALTTHIPGTKATQRKEMFDS